MSKAPLIRIVRGSDNKKGFAQQVFWESIWDVFTHRQLLKAALASNPLNETNTWGINGDQLSYGINESFVLIVFDDGETTAYTGDLNDALNSGGIFPEH